MKNLKRFNEHIVTKSMSEDIDNEFGKEILNYIKNGGKVTDISTTDTEEGLNDRYPNQKELKFTIDNHKFSIKYQPTSYRPSLSGLLTGFKYYRFIYIDSEQYHMTRSVIDDIIKAVNQTGEYIYGRSGWNDSVKINWVKSKYKFNTLLMKRWSR